MKPNILFILIDGLRSDKCYGKNKTSVTPNIDSLINDGIYFNQAISSAPQTWTSLASLFSSLYPFECLKKSNDIVTLDSNIKSFINHLKENEYSTYAFVPQAISNSLIFKKFNSETVFDSLLTLNDGIGEKILEHLKSNNMKEPWFFYIHTLDLFVGRVTKLYENISLINDDKFGTNKYERVFSIIDIWIGKILQLIDLKNTLVVITSDHGVEAGNYNKKMEEFENRLYQHDKTKIFQVSQKLATRTPDIMKPLRKKISNLYTLRRRKKIGETASKEIPESDFTPYEKRIIEKIIKKTAHIYDDRVKVPLVISGCGITSKKIISQMVRSIDIFPTIVDIVNIPKFKNIIRGHSLLPLIQGESFSELPVYIESATNSLKSPSDDVIGIRTSKFKYFRDRYDSTKNANLYDLKQDPLELKNIVKIKKDIVDEMENILSNIQTNKNFDVNESQEVLSDEETKEIEDELRKLGYIS